MTWALSLIPIVAMSVRILLTSHDRYHSVGQWDLPPYSLCHPAAATSMPPGDGWAARRDPKPKRGVFYWAGLHFRLPSGAGGSDMSLYRHQSVPRRPSF